MFFPCANPCMLLQVEKFSKTVECIGQDTISAIAEAGPQAKVGILYLSGVLNCGPLCV